DGAVSVVCAMPAERATVVCGTPACLKVTLPVGVPCLLFTAADSVNDCPTTTFVLDSDSVVVVGWKLFLLSKMWSVLAEGSTNATSGEPLPSKSATTPPPCDTGSAVPESTKLASGSPRETSTFETASVVKNSRSGIPSPLKSRLSKTLSAQQANGKPSRKVPSPLLSST